MKKLSVKERIMYGYIFNERRVYIYWYTRFILCGADFARIRRVVSRIPNWYAWCGEWVKEGQSLEGLAQEASDQGNIRLAKRLYHEAAACFHLGQHFFYIDPVQKGKALERVWVNYKKAIDLYEESQKPLRVEIPFRNAVIPGYLWRSPKPDQPLMILINGLDNLKETEQHNIAGMFIEEGFNVFAFDGPGQGEMHKSMTVIPDYHKAVSRIIDWFEENQHDRIDLRRIGTIGFSLGGYLSPLAAAHDKRINCAVGNGGPANLDFLGPRKKVHPLLQRGLPHAAGTKTYEESVVKYNLDIKKAPAMDRSLLIVHSGHDRLIPDGRKHADYFMSWAKGEKELKFYPDGEHVCANYLDEVLPYSVDWLKKRLMK